MKQERTYKLQVDGKEVTCTIKEYMAILKANGWVQVEKRGSKSYFQRMFSSHQSEGISFSSARQLLTIDETVWYGLEELQSWIDPLINIEAEDETPKSDQKPKEKAARKPAKKRAKKQAKKPVKPTEETPVNPYLEEKQTLDNV